MKEVRVSLTRQEFNKALSYVYGRGGSTRYEMFNPCDDMDGFSFHLAMLEMKYLGPAWIKKATKKVRDGQKE